MIAGLRQFVDELRRAGLCASTAEWLDALQALRQVGVEDRERFRLALRATLLKRAGQRALFDELFERFFASPRPSRSGRRRATAGGAGGRERRPRPDPDPSAPAARSRPPADPRRAAQRPPTLAHELRALRDGARPRRGRLRHVVVAPVRAAAAREPRRATGGGEVRTRELRRRMRAEEERELARELRRVVEELRLRVACRLRRTSSGRPYLRRLFRESLRSGGVPFRLPRRRPRRATARVALLVDVSWSTARAAGLFLAIAGEFLRIGRQTRVWLFVDRAVEVTAEIADGRAQRAPGRLPSPRGLNLDAPSDYGRVFHQLARSPARPRGRSTVLVVLGDGRTNVFDPLAWAFGELAAGCGAVLWLVPEPLERWGTGDSALPDYLRHVDTVVEARDLAGLARGVAALLRRL